MLWLSVQILIHFFFKIFKLKKIQLIIKKNQIYIFKNFNKIDGEVLIE